MKLQYVTCSDPRENLATDAVLQLAQSAPIVEIAIQAHPSRMSFGMPRNNWFGKLLTLRLTQMCEHLKYRSKAVYIMVRKKWESG